MCSFIYQIKMKLFDFQFPSLNIRQAKNLDGELKEA